MAIDIENKTFNIEKYKPLFEKANQNFLEPEFEPEIRKDSSYVKIYDESLEGE